MLFLTDNYTCTTISFSSFPRKMSGRSTGCHFTLSRGCNTKSTWWKSLMETGRRSNSGLNYRCTAKGKMCSNVRMRHIIHVIFSERSHNFSKMWKSSLLFFMVTYGAAMWPSLLKALSSLTQPPFMAIQSLSWALQGCLVASATLFTLPTMRRFLKHQALQKEISFTNSSII